MTSSLVGSEMCIRDRISSLTLQSTHPTPPLTSPPPHTVIARLRKLIQAGCLLYTSDAADDM
eukprot:9473973-Prorocentrum_lima.AAC.1